MTSLSGSNQSIPTPAMMQLSANCTMSWEFLTKLEADPDKLLQPDLAEAGGLGVDILTNRDQLNWEMYTVVRRLKISKDKVHSRFDNWYLVRKSDEEGYNCAIVDLTPGLAWEVVPFATTEKQVESINQRRELPSHPFNCITICGFAALTEENVQGILSQCDSSDLVQNGAIYEIEQIINRIPVFPNDISIGTLGAPRVARSPPPISAAATWPPSSPVTGDRVRVTEDGIIHVTPRLKQRHQPPRDVKGNRPKQFVATFTGPHVIDHPTESILRPKDKNMEADLVRQLSLETGAIIAPSRPLHTTNPTPPSIDIDLGVSKIKPGHKGSRSTSPSSSLFSAGTVCRVTRAFPGNVLGQAPPGFHEDATAQPWGKNHPFSQMIREHGKIDSLAPLGRLIQSMKAT